MEWLVHFDHSLFVLINSTLSNYLFDILMPVVTEQHNWYIPIFLVSLIFVLRHRKEAFWVIFVIIIAVGITDPFCSQILKPLFHRLRPCHPSYFIDSHHIFLEGCNFMYGLKTSYSLPSCHAANVFALATVLTLFYPTHFFSYYIIAIIVSYSRVYVGVHYPFDVFFGALIGTLIGVFIFYLFYHVKLMIVGKPPEYIISEYNEKE